MSLTAHNITYAIKAVHKDILATSMTHALNLTLAYISSLLVLHLIYRGSSIKAFVCNLNVSVFFLFKLINKRLQKGLKIQNGGLR